MTMLKDISHELKHHAPFTATGAVSGIILMVLLIVTGATTKLSEAAFDVFHPLHVVLSALVTTAMYRLHGGRKLWAVALIGYTGSIGIATLSDAIMPFWGGTLLGIHMHFHLPFIEPEKMPYVGVPVWILINSAAVIGIVVGGLFPTTKLPHAGHVLLSTWASLFGFTAFAMGDPNWLPRLPFVFIFLFLAVWIPCCASDIIYPLLWTKGHGRCTEEHPCHRHRE
jgi:hypothetical protein